MQPMWLCILSSSWFEDAFENTQRRKAIQMQTCEYAFSQSGTLNRHMKINGGEKSIKCSQCDYAASNENNLRSHLKKKTSWGTALQMQAVWLCYLLCASSEDSWKDTVGKNHTNVNSATMPHMVRVFWRFTGKRTMEKIQTNVTDVTMHPFRQPIWGNTWKHTVK